MSKVFNFIHDLGSVTFLVFALAWLLTASGAIGGAMLSMGSSSLTLGLLMGFCLWLFATPKPSDMVAITKLKWSLRKGVEV